MTEQNKKASNASIMEFINIHNICSAHINTTTVQKNHFGAMPFIVLVKHSPMPCQFLTKMECEQIWLQIPLKEVR